MTDEDDEFERIEMEQKFRTFDKYGHKLDSTKAAVVAEDYYWIPIDASTPTSVKILLLGRGGVASLGHYQHKPGETQFWEFWSPLPRKRP
tara:strand:- start:216 stop:485 length:270 start_codon:yes stop_codon:yes gene_type:complete